MRHPELVQRRGPDGSPTVLERLPHLVVELRAVRERVAVREHNVGPEDSRIAPAKDRGALDDVRCDRLDVVCARVRQELLVRRHLALPLKDLVREPECNAPVGAQLTPSARAPLFDLRPLPLHGLRIVGPLGEREEARWGALPGGGPDDARTGLDGRLEGGFGVLWGVGSVEVVEYRGDAVVEGLEQACECADGDLLWSQRSLERP